MAESFKSKLLSRTGLSYVFFGLSLALLTIMLLQKFAGFAVLEYTLQIWAQTGVPPALNPQLTPTINNDGGPILYYNGSGDVPPYDETSPTPKGFTPLSRTDQSEDYFYNQISALVKNSTSKCNVCLGTTGLLHDAAVSQSVSTTVDLIIRVCNLENWSIFAKTCYEQFSGIGNTGPYFVQLYAKMSQETGDYQAFCFYHNDTCSVPPTIEIDESLYFDTKPPEAEIAPEPSGKTINVLHLSDWHLDPRYDIGSEANCSQYLCCRPYSTNTKLGTGVDNASVPASRFGYLYCDSPPDLALSSFKSMPKFFNMDDVTFTIFTGDIVSHDNDDQLSRDYVGYEERITYATFKAQMGRIPIYPTLGNHDSLPEAFNTPNNIGENTGVDTAGQSNIFSWNYDLLSSLWQQDGWITGAEAQYSSNHYGAYAHTTAQGLRIISINTDFWYPDNVFNYFNFTNPDQSGILRFLISELSACEKRSQRAWIIGHVLSGYDGTNNLPNPTALFYSIVRRYAPATIAGIFFGHTHEDQLQIFYDYGASSLNGTLRNTNDRDFTKPLTVGFIGPSITPLTGNNPGYQLYQVDGKTFEITGIQTYFANVSESLTWSSPVWKFEYDSRATYSPPDGSWPANAPLNASFWHDVTERMLSNQTLVEVYNLLERRSSVATKNCSSSACGTQKVCYIRSGSGGQGALCPSTDGPF